MLSENFYLAITQGNTSGENVSVCFKNGNGMGFCFISKGHYQRAFKTWYSQDAKEKYTVGYISVDNQS